MKNEYQKGLEQTSIRTIPIASLPASATGKEVAFCIPSYQRGYRWKGNDVELLLQDLSKFLDEAGEENCRPFYCLQPLVVTTSDKHDCWEVVDGQQRLTTLFLLWKYLNDQPPYALSYDTRDRSRKFLNSPNEDEKSDNIDFHHIYHGHESIQKWFEKNKDQEEPFKELLSNVDLKGRNVRFIWYQLGHDDDAVEAFTRLNDRKIPLTDEELIRALFLSKREAGKLADGAFQHRFALEWDRIETTLQEPDFWGFLSNQPAPEGGRIRLLLELCAPEGAIIKNSTLFQKYDETLNKADAEKLRSEWQRIVSNFEQLEEWYRDPELFHLVGFRNTLIGDGSVATLRRLLKDAAGNTKFAYTTSLRQEIRNTLIGEGKTVSDLLAGLHYTENPKFIRPALALFNIATLLQTKGVQARFPFHLYHPPANAWDIEHVHSQAGEDLSHKKDQVDWFTLCLEELQRDNRGRDLSKSIDAFVKEHPNAQSFEILHKEVTEFFGESTEAKGSDGIGNLTLLDRSTNRAYKNAPFAVKRSTVLQNERAGTFILPCTRDLFLKVYSDNPGNLRQWDIEKDGTAHKEAICKTLKAFFGEKGWFTS
jgi:Protein of unknown function DUF262/Protein of unknown function (DUF1524)